jgi:hypothetical protein
MEEGRHRFERAEANIPKKECSLCYELIPISKMYAHLRTCIKEWEEYNNLPRTYYCQDQRLKGPPQKKVKENEGESECIPQSQFNDNFQSGFQEKITVQKQLPFNMENYWLNAQNKSKSKKKEIRECAISGKYCKQKPSNITKDCMVIIHIGQKGIMTKICRISHFSSTGIVPEINNLCSEMESSITTASYEENNFTCEKYKASCTGKICAGAYYTSRDACMKFCTLRCMMEHLECKRNGDWES